MIKGQASRVMSQFCTWKKQCIEISLREEIDSQYTRAERQGWSPGLVPVFNTDLSWGSDFQFQVSGGWIVPEALILGSKTRFDIDGRSQILPPCDFKNLIIFSEFLTF